MDDHTRMTWAFLLRMKSDVCAIFRSFLVHVRTQFDKQVKIIRNDNGTGFVNASCNDLFKDLGIIRQTSCAYAPQQNGVAERKHRHILDITRAIRFQGNIHLES